MGQGFLRVLMSNLWRSLFYKALTSQRTPKTLSSRNKLDFWSAATCCRFLLERGQGPFPDLQIDPKPAISADL